MDENLITKKIIGAAFNVTNSLGIGFFEKVYENAMFHELRKIGLKVEKQKAMRVFYDGIIVGDYVADLLVEDKIVVELKVVESLTNIHTAQLINYLKASQLKLGLLINFGKSRIQTKRIRND